MNLNEITFNNSYYHLQEEMIKWCQDHIGKNPGGTNWVYASPNDWEERIWCVSSMFGNTSFYFKNPSDATAFSLRWL